MQESSAAELALQRYLKLARESAGANVATLRSIVLKIVSEPDLFYGYDEIKVVLKDSLLGEEGDKVAQTLDLFSYGTFRSYAADRVLPLNDAALFKLRQLSVLALAQTACLQKCSFLTYKEIQEELGLDVIEDVVLSCIYAHVLRAKIHQQARMVKLYNENGPPVEARDVPPSQISALQKALQELSDRLQASTTALAATEHDITQEILANSALLKQAADDRKKKVAVAPNRRAKRRFGTESSTETS